MSALRRAGSATVVALALASCARPDPDRYGITSIDIEGNEALDDEAIEACLISRERPHFGLKLGLSTPACGKPPFDASPPTLRLWRWPWTEWPTFNQAVFDHDVERVKRFYRARGYYDARIVEVTVTPREAREPGKVGSCNPVKETCPASILIRVEEGEPTRVTSIEVRGLAALDAALAVSARASVPLGVGAAVDEELYEQGKAAITQVLREAGHAAAAVEGRVEVSTRERSARVTYEVEPGPVYRFGAVRVAGVSGYSARIVEEASDLRRGDRYDPKALVEAQGEVYAMGAFSSAQIRETRRDEEREVDLEIEVTPLEPNALRLNVGVMSGGLQRTSTSELESVPQWDIHLVASYERRHLFGSLAKMRIEERPRIIYNDEFPRPTPPQYGNVVKLTLSYPGLLEPRTESFFETAWDYGPEPFLSFIRSDIYFRLGSRRRFFGGALSLTLAVQQDLFVVDSSPGNVSSDGEPQHSYGISFLEEDVRLDFRDNPLRPQQGAYFGVRAAQAPRWELSDWTAFFLSPETRGYVPLFWDVVLAARVGLGAIFIGNASEELDPVARELGPTTYRLRGGGANSNRGFLAGELGAGPTGGIRRWEASSELRIPFGESFVLAGFFDVGDVNDATSFRFGHLNATAGHGFRYYTVLGAIRLDFGYRIPGLQRADGSNGIESGAEELFLIGVPGAIHLTIGDAY
ncbi:MAG TPA: POTRA domain-containing protein [Polyangiaceae bacterium]